MATFIDLELARKVTLACKRVGGKLCGERGLRWEVFVLPQSEIVACLMDEKIGVVCGQHIDKREIGRYVEDEESALEELEKK